MHTTKQRTAARWAARAGLVALAAAGSLWLATPAQAYACSGRTMYDLDGNGWDPGRKDTNGDGASDQNAIDTNGDTRADLWLIDKNQDCRVDEVASDLDRDGSADAWLVDDHQDGVFDRGYTDSLVNGQPNMAVPLPVGPRLAPPLPSGPSGNYGRGNDYPGGVSIGSGLTGLGNINGAWT